MEREARHSKASDRPRLSPQPVRTEDARLVLTSSLEMQAAAARLDPVHQKLARRHRNRKRAGRLVLMLVLLSVLLAAWRFVPWADWWTALGDASRE